RGDRRACIVRRRQQRVSRRIHASSGRHHGCRRRMRRLEKLRRLQAAHHRSVQDARPRAPQHRRQRHARRQVRTGPDRHGSQAGRVNPGLWAGRKRGVIFDVGHGGGSFVWRIAVPAMKEGFVPDSISTDLHVGSMNAGMKDMLNVMDKFLAMGMSLDDVILRSTWNPAKEIRHEELGHLSPGALADVTVLRLETGTFGLVDMYGARLGGTQKLTCELTLRDGKVVYDLNGMTRPDWDKLPRDYRQTGDARWDA